MKKNILTGSLGLLGLTALLAACMPTPAPPTYECKTGSTITNIGAVQGNADASPLVGQAQPVTVTVRGVVTLDAQNAANGPTGLGGFYVQDVAPDGKADTSDGLFIYTATKPATVKVGEVVEVTGTVKEFNGLTQLDSVTTVTSCGETTLPVPANVTLPLASATALEPTEGMRIRISQTLTVTDTFTLGRFGELGLSSGGRLFNPTNGQGGDAASNKLRTIRLDDASSKQNPTTIPYLTGTDPQTATRRAGDTVTGLEGVLHYANSAFKVQPTKAPVFVNANPRTAAPKDVGGTVKVAGANVLNYFTTLGSAGRGASNATEFTRQKAKIVAELRALNADVITLMEVENNGETALDDLVAALNAAAGSAEYASVKTGKVGTDAIRVAIIYRPARVEPIGAAQIDTNAVHSRPPVAQVFRDRAGKGVFTVMANHFKSKGSCPTTGDTDQGQGCWNLQRIEQSKAVLAFSDKLKVTDPDVLIMGDLNAYGAEDPIKTIEAAGFESLNKRIPAADRYSYQFNGEFGYLDHALASSSLGAQVSGITEWHINSDEPVVLDYNIEFKKHPECTSTTCDSPDLYAPTPYRSSDHDPVLVGLNLKADADPVIPLTVNVSGDDTVTAGQPYTLTYSTGGAPDSVTVTWGDGKTDTFTTPTGTATHTYAAAGSFTVTVTAKRGATTTTATKNVTAQPVVTAGGVYFSEYVEGSSNNKAIEIYNGTGSAIPAGSLVVNLYSNGSATPSTTNAFTLAEALPAGATYVIVNPGANAALKAKANIESAVTNFNGDDALELVLNGTRADVFGQIGTDPGTNWGSGLTSTADKTLRRKAAVKAGDTNGTDAFDPATEWDGFATDTFDGLGQR
ncbi:ExeM/NucH family extracellular endonuclease [Deinococcus sp. 14RED07]|uniref:ExeM/NucH family extracellular endonuclease n=1 Tax=Deinococcus sp. 14RED07 TaxID=2745874 RepID=UPI001E3FE64F|nr:ExeM/NucH family extracellular endonuclease [Deinococcus sp. 14RED07]MCD0175994.1 ExeM/NucH family extracellular endonuclease [Deinococcus sp. 14RED07]